MRRKLTEVMLLGVVALKAGKKIEYDGANMRITNVPARESVSPARAAGRLVIAVGHANRVIG